MYSILDVGRGSWDSDVVFLSDHGPGRHAGRDSDSDKYLLSDRGTNGDRSIALKSSETRADRIEAVGHY